MFGLTTLGLIHTLISLVPVATGAIALIRDGAITMRNTLGKVYAVTTVLTCLTALGIYQHGGFGGPHVLAIVTIVVLLAAWLAESRALFATFLFSMIPALNETTVRVPRGHPIFARPDDPTLQKLTLLLLLLFLAGVAAQIVKLRRSRAV
jgi:uncharacterized membrane protein